jgi:hypothetical protein
MIETFKKSKNTIQIQHKLIKWESISLLFILKQNSNLDTYLMLFH